MNNSFRFIEIVHVAENLYPAAIGGLNGNTNKAAALWDKLSIAGNGAVYRPSEKTIIL